MTKRLELLPCLVLLLVVLSSGEALSKPQANEESSEPASRERKPLRTQGLPPLPKSRFRDAARAETKSAGLPKRYNPPAAVDDAKKELRNPLHVCREELGQQCSEFKGRGGRRKPGALKCLQSHILLLGKSCGAAVKTYVRKSVRRACSKEVGQFCSGVEGTEWSGCLLTNETSLSKSCRAAIGETDLVAEGAGR